MSEWKTKAMGLLIVEQTEKQRDDYEKDWRVTCTQMELIRVLYYLTFRLL